jgi:hypothetical protein
MSQNELNRITNKLWSKLNCKSNENATREEQEFIIKEALNDANIEGIRLGRCYVIASMEQKINKLKNI